MGENPHRVVKAQGRFNHMFSERYNISTVPPYIVLFVSLAFISALDSSHPGL